MNTIQLNKIRLTLPSEWDDLQNHDKLFALELLYQVATGKLSPIEFRIQMLVRITGYKSQSSLFSYLLQNILYFVYVPFVASWYYIKRGKVRFLGYWQAWKLLNKPTKKDRSIIQYNLYRLSEWLNFAFCIDSNRRIAFNRVFKKNPIPSITISNTQYSGKIFNLDVAPFTDITAREFADCFDLYSGYIKTEDAEIKKQCLNRIISILYPAHSDYNTNLVSNHTDCVSQLADETKFGILYWFTGVIEYYVSHPVYSILFRSDQKETDDFMLNLGMGEIILMLERNGYANEEKMNLNKFFEAQVAELKKNISLALANGAKAEELAIQTGIDINVINSFV